MPTVTVPSVAPAPLEPHEFHLAVASDLFADIPQSSLQAILPRCVVVQCAADSVLIERGAPNQHVYLVLEGKLHVQLEDAASTYHVVIGPGECTGEISVIDGRSASATVMVVEAARLLRVDREALWHLIGATEAAARNLLLIFSGRMRRDNDLLLASLRQRREFERMATVDGLTGLHNRRWLDDVFPRQMERCTRTGQTLSLLFADVDRFKSFNDRHGHLNGDRVLQQVAAILVSSLRPTDLIARYGGEEFAALLPGASLAQAEMVAERVRSSAAQRPIDTGQPDGCWETVTMSLGVAEMRPGDKLATLAAAADAALYQAKSEGRNCVRAARR